MQKTDVTVHTMEGTIILAYTCLKSFCGICMQIRLPVVTNYSEKSGLKNSFVGRGLDNFLDLFV